MFLYGCALRERIHEEVETWSDKEGDTAAECLESVKELSSIAGLFNYIHTKHSSLIADETEPAQNM